MSTKETIYISAYLKKTDYGKPVFKKLLHELKQRAYQVKIIENHSNNEWCRDYMPIKASDGTLVKFRYKPSYLSSYKWRKTIPDVDSILKEHKLPYKSCDIKLDGGAIEIFNRTGIISQRVIEENQPSTEIEICNIIKDALKLDKIVIVPNHPEDFTGHVDGIVRFLSENTVLINDDRNVDKWTKGLNRYRKKIIQQFYSTLRLSLFNAGIGWKYLTYIEDYQYNNNVGDDNCNLYMNFLNLKKHIFMPAYDSQQIDKLAAKDLKTFFPKKEIISIPVRLLAKQGGMINCVTWQL